MTKFQLAASTVNLIDGDNAYEQLSSPDLFLSNMSPFDLQYRLKLNIAITPENFFKWKSVYIDSLRKKIQLWSDEYIFIISNIISELNRKCNIINKCKLPSEIFVILIKNDDESRSYCRNSNVIVLSINERTALVEKNVENKWKIDFPQELFHIITRNNEGLRDKLYKSIGFNRMPENKEVRLPKELQKLKITDPCSPTINYYIKLRRNSSSPERDLLTLAPIEFSNETYNPELKKNLAEYSSICFAVLDINWKVLEIISFDEVIGFNEKIGNNTKNIKNPEEILANNFILLLDDNYKVPSPNIIKIMSHIIMNHNHSSKEPENKLDRVNSIKSVNSDSANSDSANSDSANSDRANSVKKKHEFNPVFMERAIELSKYGSLIQKTGGVFGAVIVKDNKIISEGYNQVVAKKDPTWHAEMQAIREAAIACGNPHLDGCVMYTSAECCPMCLSASYWAHLDHIFYASTTKDALHYGKFADCDILMELRKEAPDRQISVSQHMQTEAVEIWKIYANMEDRVHY